VKQIVSFSGGKDSAAMLLMMVERGEPVDAVVYFDAGEWEFPQMADHIATVEAMIAPIPLVRLYPRKPFTWLMLHKEVRPRGGGNVKYVGWGWPSPLRRWCTREKTDQLDKFRRSLGADTIQAIGFAADETRRTDSANMVRLAASVRFPLVEWDVTESDALAYCRSLGLTWGGLYDIFPRVSCFCCPLQSLGELRKLRRYFPDLWGKILEWERQMNGRAWEDRRFHNARTVRDLDARFKEEDRQGFLPGCAA
jgi:3'-phosphoadenosine 5'-phosphosulfate sulfotransferase (PAPS reductase)/FAD synthetase